MLCFTMPTRRWRSPALVVITLVRDGRLWAPAMAMLSDAAESRGIGSTTRWR